MKEYKGLINGGARLYKRTSDPTENEWDRIGSNRSDERMQFSTRY
jgi:hypothetical protein